MRGAGLIALGVLLEYRAQGRFEFVLGSGIAIDMSDAQRCFWSLWLEEIFDLPELFDRLVHLPELYVAFRNSEKILRRIGSFRVSG